MTMRIVGVVVIDRDPFQLCVEVAFHLADQLANVVAKIEAISILRRHNESPHELVALLPGPHCRERVDFLTLCVEAHPFFKFLLRARPRKVASMGCPRTASAVARERSLSHAAPRVGRRLCYAEPPRARPTPTSPRLLCP